MTDDTLQIQFTDIQRLLTELQELDEKRDNLDSWWPDHGFGDGVMEEICQYGVGGFEAVIADQIKKELEKMPEGEEFSAGKFLPPNTLMAAIGAIAVGMFQIGWEAHMQYGVKKDV